MPPRYDLYDSILIGFLFRVDKMKIAALCAFAERSSSFKAYLRHKPGKGDIVVFAIYSAEFGAAVLYASIVIQAGTEIEVYFVAVTAYPLRFPAFGREVLCHMLFHAHSIHCKNERHARKLCVFLLVYKGGFARFRSDLFYGVVNFQSLQCLIILIAGKSFTVI